MARQTPDKIGWCNETWNPIRGCTHAGPACDNCWAERFAVRQRRLFPEFVTEGHWSGKIALIERALEIPLHWRKPRRIAVGLMGDWMHPNLNDIDRDAVLRIIDRCTQHLFITLTKRWSNQWTYLSAFARKMRVSLKWPLPNLIVGVSAWDQESTDRAAYWVAQTPAACRLLCLEPLLQPVDLACCLHKYQIDWVIVGGESGPGARPMDADWVRKIRDRCVAAGIPFYFKQWGTAHGAKNKHPEPLLDGRYWREIPEAARLPGEKA